MSGPYSVQGLTVLGAASPLRYRASKRIWKDVETPKLCFPADCEMSDYRSALLAEMMNWRDLLAMRAELVTMIIDKFFTS